MKSFALLLLVLVFVTLPALADHPLTHVELGGVASSDDIHDRSLVVTWRNHRRDLFWPYPGEAATAWDFTFCGELHQGDNLQNHYQGQRLAIGLGRKFSTHWLLDAAVGSHRLAESFSGTDHYIPTGDVSFFYTPATELNATVRYGHDFVYQDLIQPGGVAGHLSADSAWLDLVPRPLDAWRIPIRSSYRHFSDANNRRDIDASIMYGLATGEVWLWAGVGAEYLSFTTTQTGYWSPSRFLAAGPRLEAVVPIYGSFRIGLGANGSRFQESQFAWGWGYYATGRLELGERDGWLGSLAYTRIRASQNGTQWFSNGLVLSLSARL